MNMPQYEVVYIDKFVNVREAEMARQNLIRTFGLNPETLEKLSSGRPIVIKAKVDLDEAQRYRNAVKEAGGTAWVQELGPDGQHFERRSNCRRTMFDRRRVYRASAVVPDRRQSCGRRTSDRSMRH